jgi:hypothetical protein
MRNEFRALLKARDTSLQGCLAALWWSRQELCRVEDHHLLHGAHQSLTLRIAPAQRQRDPQAARAVPSAGQLVHRLTCSGLYPITGVARYPWARQNPMPALGTILELPVSGRWAKTARRYFAKIAGS